MNGSSEKTMEELVSICLLSYNHENYILDAMQGIINQTYKNIELLVLDDCSIDATYKMIMKKSENLNSRCTRLECAKNEKNVGNISQNCNSLIKKAKGKWIKLIGGDDILLPNCISDLVQASIKHPDAAVIHADVFIEKEQYKYGKVYSGHRIQERVSGYENERLKENLLYSDDICAPSTLFLRETFEKYGCFDEEIGWEDYEYWLRLVFEGARFYYLDKPVVIWRQGEKSVSNRDTVDGEEKLLRWIRKETAAKGKYIRKLAYEEQEKYWIYTYRYFARECKRICSEHGFAVLDDLYKDYINVTEQKTIVLNEQETRVNNRDKKETGVFNAWLDARQALKVIFEEWSAKKKTVAILGYGKIGKRLHKELCNAGVMVKFIIDYPGYHKFSTAPLYTLDEEIPNVDIVVNTMIDVCADVYDEMKKVGKDAVVDLKTMIFNSLLY